MKNSVAKNLVLLSPEDEDLRQYCHWSNTTGHISISINKFNCSLGDYIIARMGLIKRNGEVVDHINRIQFDNQRHNLRVITGQENLINNGAKGISFHKKRNKYCARVCRNYKSIHLGYFNTEKEAVKARQAYLKQEGIVYLPSKVLN